MCISSDDNKDQPGFHVMWKGGSHTPDCDEGLETNMVLVCDPEAEWSPTNSDVSQHLKHIKDGCQVSCRLLPF